MVLSETYKYEVTVSAARERVMQVLSDPFTFAGITGHMEAIQVFDSAVQDFVEPGNAKSPTAKYRVVYIFELRDNRVSTAVGQMEGPNFTPEGLSYNGSTDDGKLKWSLNVEVKGVTELESRVTFSGNVECEESFLERLVSKQKGCAEFLNKIVKSHIIPYLTTFLKPIPISSLQISPALVFSETGVLADVVPKAFRAVQDAQYGIIVIVGEDAKGKILVSYGNVIEMNVTIKLETITDISAIVKLLNCRSMAKVFAYSVNVDAQVKEVLDQVYNQVIRRELFGR